MLTHTQTHFLFPPPTCPLFLVLPSLLWGTRAGHPLGCSREGCYLQVPTPRFPPALFRFDTCVWAVVRAICLPRQTWLGHRCLPPPLLPSPLGCMGASYGESTFHYNAATLPLWSTNPEPPEPETCLAWPKKRFPPPPLFWV